MAAREGGHFFWSINLVFRKSGVSLHPRISNTLKYIDYVFFDFVMLASFVIALVVGPFVVGSCNPVLWVFYLSLCTMLTPLLGIPIYKAIFR